MPPAPTPPSGPQNTQTYPAPNPASADGSPTVPAAPPPSFPPAPPPRYAPSPAAAPAPAPRPRAQGGAPILIMPAPAARQRVVPRALPQPTGRNLPVARAGSAPGVYVYPRTYPRTQGNAWAVASLLCVVAGVVLFPFAIMISPFGIIFGHVARGRIKRHPDVNNRTMANICLVLNYIIFSVSCLTLVVLVAWGWALVNSILR